MTELNLIVENERDERVLAWVLNRYSEAQILAAKKHLIGRRKTYLSNICKALGAVIPEKLQYTPPEQAKLHIQKIREILQTGTRF